MTHVMPPDERRRWRLASGAELHASERYDGAQPCTSLAVIMYRTALVLIMLLVLP